MTKCKVCNGTGAYSQSDELTSLPCQHCHGTGEEPEPQQRPASKGTYDAGAEVPRDWDPAEIIELIQAARGLLFSLDNLTAEESAAGARHIERERLRRILARLDVKP